MTDLAPPGRAVSDKEDPVIAAAEALAAAVTASVDAGALPLAVVREEIDRRADTYERWQAAGLPLSSDLFGLAVESVARDITGRTRFVPRQRKATP